MSQLKKKKIHSKNTQLNQYELIDLKNQGGLIYPAEDLVTLIFSCEKLFTKYIPFNKSIIWLLKKYGTIASLFKDSVAHFNSQTFQLSSHYYSLIKLCCETNLNLRLHHGSKLASQSTRSQSEEIWEK